MPFAEMRRRVTGRRKRFGDGYFPLRQPVGRARQRHRMRPRTNRKAPGHERRTTRRTLRFDVEIREPRAFARELVDARRRRAAQLAAAVTADLAVAEIVHQDKNDVRLLCGLPKYRIS